VKLSRSIKQGMCGLHTKLKKRLGLARQPTQRFGPSDRKHLLAYRDRPKQRLLIACIQCTAEAALVN